MTTRMQNLNVLGTTTEALKVLAAASAEKIDHLHSFREAVVVAAEAEVASTTSIMPLAAVMMTSSSNPLINHNSRRSMEHRLINRKGTRDGAEVVDIKVSNSSSKTPATTSLATNKKLVNSTSPAITTTTVEVVVAVEVINSKPPVSGTSATVSILRERGAKNMARSSLQTMPLKSSCPR